MTFMYIQYSSADTIVYNFNRTYCAMPYQSISVFSIQQNTM